MANEIAELNTIEIADIEKVNTLTDDNIADINTLEFTGFSPPAWGNTRAVIAGGTASVDSDLGRIQYKTVGAAATALNFDDLQTTRSMHQCAGSNGTRGIFGGGGGRSGGAPVRGVSDSDYVTIASTGSAADYADIDTPATYGGRCGASNGTLLFSAGGYDGVSSPTATLDFMEYFTISTTNAGQKAGDLSAAKTGANSTNGDTRFIVNGGYVSGVGSTDVMEYNNFSTSADVQPFGDLSSGTNTNSSVCTTIRAAMHCPVIGKERIEYVTVASTGDYTDWGDLDVSRDSSTGTSDGVTGEFFGGADADSGASITSTEKITIMTGTTGTEVGDLIEANRHAGATSGI